MELEITKLSKTEIELEIFRIFKKSKPTVKDLMKSRSLTKRFIKETNYQINEQMELKLINGKWLWASEDGSSETYFRLPEVKRKQFSILLNCELILAKHNIKAKKEIQEESLFSELIGITKEILFGLAEIITKREPKFIDEFDYEIYEHNYWKK